MKKLLATITILITLFLCACTPNNVPNQTPALPANNASPTPYLVANPTPEAVETKTSPIAQVNISEDGKLNLRSKPNTSSKVITTLKDNHIIQVVKIQGDWCFVNTSKDTGWCAKKYLDFIDISNGFEELDKIYLAETGYNASRVYKTIADNEQYKPYYLRCYYYFCFDSDARLASEACDAYLFDSENNFISILPGVFSDWKAFNYQRYGVISLDVRTFNFSNTSPDSNKWASDIVLVSGSVLQTGTEQLFSNVKVEDRYSVINDLWDGGTEEYYYEHFVYTDGYYVREDYEYNIEATEKLDSFNGWCYSSKSNVFNSKYDQYAINEFFDKNYKKQ